MPAGFVSTSSGLLVPAGTAVTAAPLPAASAPTTRRRGPRIRLALLTGLVLFLLACAGLSLPVSVATIIAAAGGYDVLADRGVLPALSGPWLDPP